MAGWHHWLDGRESQWTLGVGDGQGGLACCDSWGRKESNTTERLIWSDMISIVFAILFSFLLFLPLQINYRIRFFGIHQNYLLGFWLVLHESLDQLGKNWCLDNFGSSYLWAGTLHLFSSLISFIRISNFPHVALTYILLGLYQAVSFAGSAYVMLLYVYFYFKFHFFIPGIMKNNGFFHINLVFWNLL